MNKLIVSLGDLPNMGRSVCGEIWSGLMSRRGVCHQLVQSSPDQITANASAVPLLNEGKWTLRDVIPILDDAPAVFLDVATGDGAAFASFFERREVGDVLDELDFALTILLPITDSPKSEEAAVAFAETFRQHADFVLMRRAEAASGRSGWAVPAAERAMYHLGAQELIVPALPDVLAGALEDNGGKLTRLLAERKRLPRTLAQVLHTWELEYAAQIEALGDLLSPGDLRHIPAGETIELTPSRRSYASSETVGDWV